MATEIYLQPELEELVIDPQQANRMDGKDRGLGSGRAEKANQELRQRIGPPYTFMNEQMKLVFQTLCPTKAEVNKYDKSAIPLDVLSHVALCKQEGYFSKLEIWYDNKSPDPVLVGHLTDKYNSAMHLIARWGDEVIPYEQLLEKAVHRYTNAFILSAQECKQQCENAIANGTTIIRQLFVGAKTAWSINPSFSLNLQVQEADLPF